jgi:hypothetical protein
LFGLVGDIDRAMVKPPDILRAHFDEHPALICLAEMA